MGSVCGGFACIQVAEIGASVFNIPNIDRSDYRSAEVSVSALRISDLGNQGMSLSRVHI